MTDLLNIPSVRQWLDSIACCSPINDAFGNILPRVIWTDARDKNGALLVSLEPLELVASFDRKPYMILDGHDPGKPIGQVLKGNFFESEKGIRFVVAILGFYVGGNVLKFDQLRFLFDEQVTSPKSLPELSDRTSIEIGIDPREVNAELFHLLQENTEFPIEIKKLSLNAIETINELIVVGLPYLALVWNPYITTIATEAGKDTYSTIKRCLRSILRVLQNCRNPVLEIQSYQDGCHVSFVLRGNDFEKNSVALDAIQEMTAIRAARLIINLRNRDMPVQKIVYEFNYHTLSWYPSYAVLFNNKIITNKIEFAAIEKLPMQLSLGFSADSHKS